jgi:D-alanine-D-alanine ligase-like ATP-grasp enzyme
VSPIPEHSLQDRCTAELKRALTGRDDARFVWLCNFQVETEWARNYIGMPAVPVSATSATVQRMEQLGALIASADDHLLLGTGLDEEYCRYLEAIGLTVPGQLVAGAAEPGTRTTDAVLGSPGLMRRLRELGERGAFLMPMGNSAQEQKLADATGLRMAGPDVGTFERVNSKIYSRRLTEELGLRAIPGYTCETVGDLIAALEEPPSTDRPVIVKDAYGVSGKGLFVLDTPAKAQRLVRMAGRRAQKTGIDTLHVVVEQFLSKRFDLNYQFTIDRAGQVRLDFVKEALTAGGVHQGHIMPSALTAAQRQDVEEAAERIGKRMHADGFFGVVGVDALLGTDDLIYPVVEINARLNMSSYQARLTERFLRPAHVALARHYQLQLYRTVSFSEVRDELGDLAAAPAAGRGLVITCFGTVNAQSAASAPFPGRLYTMLFAADRTELAELDARVSTALNRLGERTRS